MKKTHLLSDNERNAIEEASLKLLDDIQKKFGLFVIGGWAVRGLAKEHLRYTYDVDGVVKNEKELKKLYRHLEKMRLPYEERFYGKSFKKEIVFRDKRFKFDVEFSLPKIYSRDRKTFFVFDLDDVIEVEIKSMSGYSIKARMPSAEQIAANKLSFGGWKNIYDVGSLYNKIRTEKLLKILGKQQSGYREKVAKNIKRFISIISRPTSPLEMRIIELLKKHVDLKEYVKWLKGLANDTIV